MNSVLTIFAKSAVHLFTVCVKFLSVKTNKLIKNLLKKVIPENEHLMNVHFWYELSPLVLCHLVLHGAARDVSCLANLSKADFLCSKICQKSHTFKIRKRLIG